MSLGTYIINGTPVSSAATYPWFCQVTSDGICGGSYIGDNCVLTAAHCFFDNDGNFVNNPGAWTIRMGTLDRDTGGSTYSVVSIIPNPSYDPKVGPAFDNNDIAILKLNKNPSDDGFVPVNVVTPALRDALEAVGKDTIVMGFGLTTDGGEVSPILLEATVKVVGVGTAECQFNPNWNNEAYAYDNTQKIVPETNGPLTGYRTGPLDVNRSAVANIFRKSDYRGKKINELKVGLGYINSVTTQPLDAGYRVIIYNGSGAAAGGGPAPAESGTYSHEFEISPIPLIDNPSPSGDNPADKVGFYNVSGLNFDIDTLISTEFFFIAVEWTPFLE
ncbi:unnamed protein product, partial [marine sediment metagenome]